MNEATFIKQNKKKWEGFELLIKEGAAAKADKLAEVYIKITDDLAFSRTHFAKSQLTPYLNSLASDIHLSIYKNKKEDSSRFIDFWKFELPQVMSESLKYVLISFIIFSVSGIIGALSAAHDDTFVRLIMGDQYVNATLSNIDKGDPMAVYKQMGQTEMFLGITFNNIRVSFIVFIAGVFTSFAAGYVLFTNGIMLGAFQYFFYQKGLLMTSVLTIWIHGTLEISAIIMAGAAGIIMGNGLLFPGTHSRLQSFKNGAKKGLKIIIGLIPVFILAGFLEGFVTRMTGMPDLIKIAIILGSAIFIFIYFIFIPLKIKFNGLRSKDKLLQSQELQSEA
jgi:uncharacterized membrane protein SpoIIM required for sporulation